MKTELILNLQAVLEDQNAAINTLFEENKTLARHICFLWVVILSFISWAIWQSF